MGRLLTALGDQGTPAQASRCANAPQARGCARPVFGLISDTMRRFQTANMATEPISAGDAARLRPTRKLLGFSWPASVTPAERATLLAGGLGWMLDAMDVSLYSLVLAHLLRDLSMAKNVAGGLQSLTLIASAVGGLLFGFLADR